MFIISTRVQYSFNFNLTVVEKFGYLSAKFINLRPFLERRIVEL